MPITAPAVPGVVVAILLAGMGTAFAIAPLARPSTLTLQRGLILGALVAATDPIAVISIFESSIRDLLVTLTFGVVLLSILVQGLTMQRLLWAVRFSKVEAGGH